MGDQELIRQLRSRAAQLRGCGAPMIFAGISELNSMATHTRTSTVSVVYGTDDPQAWQDDYICWVMAARIMAESAFLAINPAPDATFKNIILAGELTASWAKRSGTVLEAVNAMTMATRQYLSAPARVNEIQASLTRILSTAVGDAAPRTITHHNIAMSITTQCQRLLLSRAIAIPLIFLPAAVQERMRAILVANFNNRNVDNYNVTPPVIGNENEPFEVILDNEYHTRVAVLTSVEARKWIVFLAHINQVALRLDAYGSIFLAVVAMAKGCDVTAYYMTNRATRFLSDLGITDAELGNYADKDVLTKFCMTYRRDNVSAEIMYPIIVSSAAALGNQDVNSLVWILEQAAAQHITYAQCFARAIVQMQTLFPAYIFLSIPEGQIRNYALLCARIHRNRFDSITKPAVPAALYADLGYLGFMLCKLVLKDENIDSYAGNLKPHLTKPQSYFDTMCKDLAGRENDYTSGMTGLEAFLKSVLQTNLGVEDEFVYMVKPTVQGYADFPPLEGVLPELPAGQVEDMDLDARVGWPRSKKKMARNVGRITINQMIDYVRRKETAQHKALRTVSDWMHSAAAQKSLEEIAVNATSIATCKRNLTAEEKAVVRLLGVTDDMIPDYAPGDMVAHHMTRELPGGGHDVLAPRAQMPQPLNELVVLANGGMIYGTHALVVPQAGA